MSTKPGQLYFFGTERHPIITWQAAWEILGPLGGGRGRTDLVRDRNTQELGVLKRLHEREEHQRTRRLRFVKEVLALQALRGHRGVPELLASVPLELDAEEELFVVLEFIPGCTLTEHVSGRPQPLDDALGITRQLAEILRDTHTADIHHRDIKPDNIILRDRDLACLYLIDFGLARPPEEEAQAQLAQFPTGADERLGNRFLRLPEHEPGQRRDERADITLAVGVLFYMLTGAAPEYLADATGSPPHEAKKDIVPPGLQNDSRWPRVQWLLDRGMRYSVDERFQSADELLTALATVEERPVAAERHRAERARRDIEEALGRGSARRLDEAAKIMAQMHERFAAAVDGELPARVYRMGPERGVVVDGGRRVIANHYIATESTGNRATWWVHVTACSGNRIQGRWAHGTELDIGGQQPYTEGTLGDARRLYEAAEESGRSCAAELLERFAQVLSQLDSAGPSESAGA